MPDISLSIVIPVYNEVESLSLLYEQLSEVLVRLETDDKGSVEVETLTITIKGRR